MLAVFLNVFGRMGLRRSLLTAVAGVLGLCTYGAALAQTGQGAINGRVTDQKGALVPRSSVTVTNVQTGIKKTTLTNGSGFYSVQSLNPGTYTVQVAANGFEATLTDNVIVSAAESVESDVTLLVGKESVSVTVNAQGALLSRESDVTTTVDNKIVEDLPYPERSSLEASLLVPGVSGDPLVPGGIGTENGGIFTGYVTPGSSIQIGGAPPGTSSILVDGSDVTQASYARAGVNLSGKDVQEVTVITSGLSAKYGRTGAGVIVQTSRAGESLYHGGVTWRHTDPYFNAYPLGGTIPSNLHENFYGYYLGGPVWIPRVYEKKEKTFFFVGIEPARIRNTIGARGTFQTPEELAGHFYNSLYLINTTVLKSSGYAAALLVPRVGQSPATPAAGQPNTSSLFYQSPVNAQGFPTGAAYSSSGLYVPITGPLSDCATAYGLSPNPGATTCVDDVAPQLSQNAFAKYVLSNFPTPSNPGPYVHFDNANATPATDATNASYNRGVINHDNRYSFRIDQQFNNNNTIFVRYTVIPVTGSRYLAVTSDNPVSQAPVDAAHTHDVALGFTHVISNNLVVNFHYSFLRDNQQRTAPLATLGSDTAAKYGLTPAISGYGFPNLAGFNSNGVNYTLQPGNVTAGTQVDQNFIGGADVTWTKGSHLFQFGTDLRWIQSNQYDFSGLTGGKYGFSANGTYNGSSGGSPLASFDLGLISAFSNTPKAVPGYYRWRYYAGYFQDDWRATPKLTLNLGLRYEVETPRSEKFNNQAFVYNNINGTTPNGTAATSAFCFSGACGTPTSLWKTNYFGIEPRIGLAYAINSKSTLRASYAMARVPLSGYENTPDPNFNIGSGSVGGQTGGVNTGFVDYITNPVGPVSSVFTALQGSHGPFFYSTGVAPEFVDGFNSAVPYIQTYSLSYQQQLTSRTIVQATYQGTKGTHLIGSFPLAYNTPSINTLITAIQQGQNLSLSTPNTLGITNPGSTVSINESNLQRLNPYQNFFNQSLNLIYPRIGELHYNAMYLSVNQRFNKHISFLGSYTWSKSLDDVPDVNGGSQSGASGISTVQNPFDTRSEYSVSNYDQPSRLKGAYTVNLPLGVGERFHTGVRVIDQIIGNISTAGILSSASGFPSFVQLGTAGYFTSVTPGGVNGCVVSGTNKFCTSSALPSGYVLRPNIVPGVPLINPNWKHNPFNSLASGGITPYLNPAAFVTPGSPGNPQLGTAPRTLSNARSPREFFFDAKISKGFSVRERYRVNINAAFNNVLNHPTYFGPATRTVFSSETVSTVTGLFSTPTVNASFGNASQANSATNTRVIRVGAEFSF